jgi:hypothetical protein
MVTASVSPGLMETETSMSQRLVIFSSQFAAQTCPKGYDFVNNPATDQPVPGGLAQRTKTYRFPMPMSFASESILFEHTSATSLRIGDGSRPANARQRRACILGMTRQNSPMLGKLSLSDWLRIPSASPHLFTCSLRRTKIDRRGAYRCNHNQFLSTLCYESEQTSCQDFEIGSGATFLPEQLGDLLSVCLSECRDHIE